VPVAPDLRKGVVPADAAVERSGRVQVGVRPEKLVLLPLGEEPPSGRNRLEGTIADASYLGTSTQYVIDTAWGQALTVFAQNTHRDERLVPGSAVQLTWEPAHTFAVHAGAEPAPQEEAAAAPEEPETPGTVADAIAGDGRR
jgi:spermidine/putrescine transport system ATP-binding protein